MTQTALLIAHGQPSDPGPAEEDLARLAESVEKSLQGWRVGSATLAQPGAVEAALRELGRPVVVPFFMADGWFARTEVPRRLAAAGAEGLNILPVFGLMKEVGELAIGAARASILGRGWRIEESCLVLAAHGSGRSRAPAVAAGQIAAAIRSALPLRDLRLGFIEEAPLISDVARDAGQCAICLPLFVARWGHVLSDIPQSLRSAGFAGPCLAPIGVRREVHAILAGAIARAGVETISAPAMRD